MKRLKATIMYHTALVLLWINRFLSRAVEKERHKTRLRFIHNEVGSGRITVVWRDVDNQAMAWSMSADDEVVLFEIARRIVVMKQKKLEDIIGKEVMISGNNEERQEGR